MVGLTLELGTGMLGGPWGPQHLRPLCEVSGPQLALGPEFLRPATWSSVSKEEPSLGFSAVPSLAMASPCLSGLI